MAHSIQLALALISVFLGALLQGSVGVGLGIFAAPILALVDPHHHYLPGPLITNAMVLSLLVALRERRSLVLGNVGWALVGRAPGVALGAALLTVATNQWLDLLLGGLLLVCVALSVSKLEIAPSRRTLFGAGLLSGIFGTTTSVGGPPIALVLQREIGPRVRSTLAGYFVIGTLFSLTALSLTGHYRGTEVLLSLRLLPAMLLGFLLSGRTRGFFDRGFVRPAILAVSGIAAAFVLLRGVARLLGWI